MEGRCFEPSRRLGGVVLIAGLLSAVAPSVTQGAESYVPRAAGAQGLDGLHAIGPPLTALRAKLADRSWLVAWLRNPGRLRRHPLMRRLRLSVEEAQAVAEYLYAEPPLHDSVEWQGGDARTGALLFVARGCRGCHAIEPTEQSFSPRVPHLSGIGVKVRGDWLFKWLKSPRSYDPNTAMPELGLSDDDTRHLVAFLLSHREGAEAVGAAPRVKARAPADLARDTIRRFDCARCHLIRGFQTVALPDRWTVAPRSCANCHEASGSSLPADARETKVPQDNWAAVALRDGRRLVAYYNCGGCHRIEGRGGDIAEHLERKTFAPPALDGEGARVQTSWLINYLRQPTTTRLWLQMRMPDYGLSNVEAMALAQYFAALAHVPPSDEPQVTVPQATTALGLRRFAHFKCLQCHPASPDAQLPEGVDLEDLSINLMLAKTRLRPSWIRDFLARPKTVVGTETRMPAVFYTTDGIPKVEHPDEDIMAITAYLFQMTEPGPAAPSSPPHSNVPGDQQPVDWTTNPY